MKFFTLRHHLGWLLAGLPLLACGVLQLSIEPPASATSPATGAPPVSTATESPAPTDSPQPASPIPTSTSTECCTPTPTPGFVILPPVPTAKEKLTSWLSLAWAARADPALLRPSLEQAGWMIPDGACCLGNPKTQEINLWRVLDLNGDGAAEWVITVITGKQPTGADTGRLLVINGSGVALEYSVEESPFMKPPIVLAAVDMTGDGLPELVTESQHCGASTCFGTYRVFSAHFGIVENITHAVNVLDSPYGNCVSNVEPTAPILPEIDISSASAQISDITGDGLPDLIVEGGGAASAAAGPPTRCRTVWSWTGQAIALSSLSILPTP